MMNHRRIDIEYPLATKSPNIIWEFISSAHGLERWLADHVEEDNGLFTFTWGEPWTQQEVKTAQLVNYVKYDRIQLAWDYSDDEEVYMEMRIIRSELTGMLSLAITDFAEPGDEDNLRTLWTNNLERLHRTSGL